MSASSLRSMRRIARWSAMLIMPLDTIGMRPECESSRDLMIDEPPESTIVTLLAPSGANFTSVSRASTRMRLFAITISSS